MTVLADGTETQALLPNMLPGVTYQVTIFAGKGLEESDPGSENITTGVWLLFSIHLHIWPFTKYMKLYNTFTFKSQCYEEDRQKSLCYA